MQAKKLLPAIKELLCSCDTTLEAILEGPIALPSVDVFRDGGPDYFGDRLVIYCRDCFKLFSLVSGQTDGHCFGWSHTAPNLGCATAPVNHHDFLVAWYRGITILKSGGNMTDQPNDETKKPHEFQIQIDRTHYTVAKEQMTGSELRQVPNPPIGPERDLFEVVPGHPDRKVGENDSIEIKSGARFFTAPAHINPGKREVTA
jgi:hypothetical protein